LNFERLAGALASKASFFSVLTSRPDVCRMLVLLLGSSQHLSDILTRDPDHFEWLIDTGGRLRRIPSRAYYDREIAKALTPYDSVGDRMDALRRLSRRELLRIGAADLIGGRPIHRVADELSDLADATLECVIRECMGELESRYGCPKHEDGSDASFSIIGLGKLGGQELNFSSDIDLMFAYSAEGMTDGVGDRARSVTNQEYYSRLSEQIVQAVSEPTQEGFLYRVDTRLRPDGAAGALTMPVNAYEAYYARRGELWERQMLIKARLVAGSKDLGRRFLKMIHPFIYPGHIDGSPVEEIHRIKQRIEGKLGKKGTADSHLKLRSGGIRDVEFVVQCLQMIVGQVHSQVRSGHTLEAIQQLVAVAALTGVQGSALSNAYVFYRRLEHRLQMMHGLSDYALPETEESQLPMARSIGFETAGEYSIQLDEHLADVQAIYNEIFSGGDDPGSSRSVATICEVELGDPDAQQALSEIGFARPDQAHRNLVYLAFGHAPRIRGTQARRSFMELAPVLIDSLVETADPDQALGNLERLVSAYGAGNTFFQTLNLNPGLRSLLLKLCAGSEFLVGILVRNPGLLDWLTHPSVLHRERSKEDLDLELDAVLERAPAELQIAALNGFKNRELLRIGSRDLVRLTRRSKRSRFWLRGF
jgi:glutamate-ammonia-ligase adenylyltransferase